MQEQPLAYQIRPQKLNEIIGQEHLLAEGGILDRQLKAGMLFSMILYGPPGTGKTTIARVIANETEAEFYEVNATTAKKADLERIAKRTLNGNRCPVLFIDEIHRFNKAQQDYLLPFVENGSLILIGATTENPYFEVNKALLSRSTVLTLNSLSHQNLDDVITRTITKLRDLPHKNHLCVMPDDARRLLIELSNGDARKIINAIELAVKTTRTLKGTHESSISPTILTVEIIEHCIQGKSITYDKTGDNHYDVISAFIKSIRGSDPDATLYYLALMIEAGEDPKYIARRIMIHASEDVGLADSNVLTVCTSACLATERIGFPEARIILAHAALAVACAPKSNSVLVGIDAAIEKVKKASASVPAHLTDSHYKGASALGKGQGYLYPHDYPKHFVQQPYLPEKLINARLYHPSNQGAERSIASLLNWQRQTP